MKNARIAIIDSGISGKSEAFNNLIESYSLSKKDGFLTVTQSETLDYIGHGTAVAHIIHTINNNVDLLSFRICNDVMDVDEEGLLYLLEYIYDNIEVDIINISAGITYLTKYKELDEVCRKLYQKGVVIVSAFDNDGAISYPAAFNEVVGVDVRDEYKNRNDIYYVKNSIIDIFVPNIYYRTMSKDKKTILKGSSFAAAKITGLLSQKIHEFNPSSTKIDLLKTIANICLDVEINESIEAPRFKINKAIIFPLNKESHALLRFKDMLIFKIAGVYDERLSGNVGKTIYDESISSFDSINWDDDFDTVILSCTSELSSITKRQYDNEVINKAKEHNKNVYTFENVLSDYEKLFYPNVTASVVPQGNFLKLHKVTIPIVGVFGTSSKQGKFTLQLELIKRLSKLGYKTGHISTEPSGYLFNADYVFHFGYHSYLKIQPWESIAILNNMIWQTQLKEKDILITGCQSGTLHYNNSQIEHFAIFQYAFTLGAMPDFCVLTVNPHDDIEYINRTINFINSIDDGKVRALVVFPIQAVETLSGIKYKTQKLLGSELVILKEKFQKRFKIPVYCLGNDADIEELTNFIISFFAS
ncbi:S8 family peptidase [Paenibacillus sonchi]|uniref:S8 family peptidase n=1 Tax=Paenibacillus sonchi TaxID=373687 RepID=UPI001E561F98|nr:S8 family serine peptidase [Paenibacillus sonchi]MCE3203135.1 S8 family serine peptidase [Paenibacillus sonchi]